MNRSGAPLPSAPAPQEPLQRSAESTPDIDWYSPTAHADRIDRALAEMTNTDPDLHSVYWTPDAGVSGVFARAAPGATRTTPQPYVVSRPTGRTEHPSEPLPEHPADFRNTVYAVTRRTELQPDGVIDARVDWLYPSAEADGADEASPLNTELSLIFTEAAYCWRHGSQAELRIMAHVGNELFVVTAQPHVNSGDLFIRSYSEEFTEEQGRQIDAVNYREYFSGPHQETLHLPRHLLNDLEFQTDRVRQHSGQVNPQGHDPYGRPTDDLKTVMSRQGLQRDLYELQTELIHRSGREISSEIDHGEPWGKIRASWTEDAACETVLTPSSLDVQPIPWPPTAPPEGTRSLERLSALIRDTSAGELYLAFSNPRKIREIKIHPELTLMLKQALFTVPAPTLSLRLDLHPLNANSGVHAWSTYDLMAGQTSSTTVHLRPDGLVICTTDEHGRSRSGFNVPVGIGQSLGRICRKYLNEDIPKWHQLHSRP